MWLEACPKLLLFKQVTIEFIQCLLHLLLALLLQQMPLKPFLRLPFSFVLFFLVLSSTVPILFTASLVLFIFVHALLLPFHVLSLLPFQFALALWLPPFTFYRAPLFFVHGPFSLSLPKFC